MTRRRARSDRLCVGFFSGDRSMSNGLHKIVISAIAGSACSFAVAGPQPPQHLQGRQIDPIAVMTFTRDAQGNIRPTSPLMPYQGRVTDDPTLLAFDMFQSDTTGAPTGGDAC